MLHEDIHLYAPEFLFVELAKYKELIMQKTGRSEEEFDEVISVLHKYIHFIPMEDFVTSLKEAERISPDPKDVTYLALALRMKIPVWSNDKDLRLKQNSVKVISTRDIVSMLV